ncbi:alpha-ketoglutarate-dependent dioxygenase alkB homolog 7, mitochondrial isoform X2 [Spodoptera litura]|uniref:Alpha-ketoglutarate-dependent dioxygenase alkB homolog 7, mitochondrial isoform X2 n=1 Tax=Spodoptera litura TaxID=69820 RepID=A0A9J7J264_SPOLT|nr:alpha-ketoglutarate-dependent dioxygenase alkB homolog 7, mitochondrial isoform X2 [Spodoptera litura]
MRLLTFSFIKTCKYRKLCGTFPRSISGLVQPDVMPVTGDPNLVDITSWKEDEEPELRSAVLADMQVYPDFISEKEENALLQELEPILRRMRYEFDHWDNAIQGFRETERRDWSAESSAVLSRVKALAFSAAGGAPLAVLPHVHVLDLAAAGHIKPHVDAVRFCGNVIAGLCLVSSAVMELVHTEKSHLQLHALLARRALYIMNGSMWYRGAARYSFTHAVLGGARSAWRGRPLPRARRVALICRSAPHRDTDD